MKKVLFSVSLILLCTFFCTPIFASDTDTDVSLFPVGFYEDEVYDKLASDTRATTYTTTDIYNLLVSALSGNNYMSAYSLPQIANYTSRIAQILYGSGQSVPSTSLYSRINTINTNLSNLFHAVVDGDSTSIPVGPGIRQMLYGIDSGGDWETLFDTSQDSRDLLQLIYGSSQQIHGDGQNNSSYLSQLVNSVGVLNSAWTPFSITYNGWSSSLDGTYDTSTNPPNAYDATYYFKFTNASGANTYRFSRIFLNMINTGISDSSRVTVYAPVANHMYEFPPETSYLMGRYLYLTDLPNNFASSQSFIIKIEFDYVSFTSTKNLTAEYLPDSFFSLLSNAELDLRLINRSIGSFSNDLSVLRDVYASQDLIDAKQSQQPVEDAVISDFSGSGTESLKLTDVGAVKNTSGALKTMLHAGGDIVKVYNVLRFNSMYGFFSNEVANETETWFNETTTRGSEFISDSDYYANLNAYLDSLDYDSR